MATKPVTKPKRRRRHTSVSATPKRRRTHTKKGFMGDLMNPTIAMHSAKSTLAASGGAMGSVFVQKMLPATMGKFPKVLIALGGGFLINSFGMPSVGNGFTAGMIALNFQNGFLNDDGPQNNAYADPYSLSDKPLYLDADGEPFVIEEDEMSGEAYTRYLSEEEKELVNM
jgi:hypothetical protein